MKLWVLIGLFIASSSFKVVQRRVDNRCCDLHNYQSSFIQLNAWVDQQGSAYNYDENAVAVKILSYNVLGPMHGESFKHSYAPASITKWANRRDRLLKELRNEVYDVICLQEVTYKSLKETFIPGLQLADLQLASFAPSKTSSHRTGNQGHKYIGCATFFRKSKIRAILAKPVHLRLIYRSPYSTFYNYTTLSLLHQKLCRYRA